MNIYSDIKAENILKEMYSKELMLKNPLQVITLSDATILPNKDRLGGVVDKEGHFVWESAYKYGDTNLWGGSYEVVTEDIEYIPEKVIFIGQMQTHWGNFLYDCMARIWYVLQEKESYRIVYCGMQSEEGMLSDSNKKYHEFLQLLDITPDRLLDIRKATKFETVIIPQLMVFPGTFYTKEFINVFDIAIKNANKQMTGMLYYDKIYFTRRQMTACKELGEKEIEKIFEANGFQVIAPESLSLNEQIYYLNHCKVFVSIEGTASHNIIFANEAVEHIILRKQDYINTRQIIFNKARNVMPQYIDIFYEPFTSYPISHDTGPFWVGVTVFMRRWIKQNAFSCSWKRHFANMMANLRNRMIYILKCPYYKYWLKY